jgi:DNA (cytosine-5)-methyltransferase 1
MKHLDLFSGIGGFSLACQWAGIETICFVEIDKFCQKILNKHWQGVPIIGDINNVKEIKQVVENAIGIRRSHGEPCEKGTEVREQWEPISGDGNGVYREQITPNPNGDGLQEPWPEQQTSGDRQFLQTSENSVKSRIRGESKEITNQGRSTCEDRGEGIRQGNGEISASRIGTADKLLLTGGFPCQPFSNAGRKRGSSDDRYLWPQTLAVIEAVKPDWVILENVPGILNMVFPDSEVGVASQSTLFGVENDEICDYNTISGGIERDLRQAGYETVWLLIPACSLSAPHRRDRVWIVGNNKYWGREKVSRVCKEISNSARGDGVVANSVGARTWSNKREIADKRWSTSKDRREGIRQENGQVSASGINPADKYGITPHSDRTGNRTSTDGINREGEESNERQNEQPQPEYIGQDSDVANPDNSSSSRQRQNGRSLYGEPEPKGFNNSIGMPGWSENWHEVATRVCTLDDGVSNELVRPKGWRVNALKAAGNAIVPQVAYQLIKAILEADKLGDISELGVNQA